MAKHKQQWLSAEEVIKLTRIECSTNQKALEDDRTVKKCIITLFGKGGYQTFVDSLIDYDGTPVFNTTQSYNVGDTVLFQSIAYVCIQDTSGTIEETPKNKCYWEIAPKFDNECLQNLWCECLSPYLALQVLQVNAYKIRNVVAAAGVVMAQGEGYKALSDKQYESWLQGVKNESDSAYESMLMCCFESEEGCGYTIYTACEGLIQHKVVHPQETGEEYQGYAVNGAARDKTFIDGFDYYRQW